MYNPSEDSFLLLKAIENMRGKDALEIGTGSGIITEQLCKNFRTVIATDINLNALKQNITFNYSNNFLICCDTTCPIRYEFDLIVFNPPYLPDDKEVKDNTIHGGKEGIEITIKFLNSAKNKIKRSGRIVFLLSSLSKHTRLERFMYSNWSGRKVLLEKNLFYEKLEVIELTKKKAISLD
jgi:release factor glutamine methyltransferase